MVRRRVAPKDYNNPNTRALTSKTFIGKIGEFLGFNKGLSPDQLKTRLASLSQKAVKQAINKMGVYGVGAGIISTQVIPALKKYHQSDVRKKLVSDKKQSNKMMAEAMGMKPKPKRSYSKITSAGAKIKVKLLL